MTHPWIASLIAVICLTAGTVTFGAAPTYRLYQGLTIYVNNDDGRAFDVNLVVRDLNLFSYGPREVLFKVYDSEGHTPVREIIPDDGIAGEGFLPRLGGWDHEMWYYALCYTRGSKPMFPWSMYTEPARVAAMPSRSFQRHIPKGKPGVYRIELVGTRDHLVTAEIDPQMPTAVAGGHSWLHGHDKMFAKSYIYIPKGSIQLHMAVIEMDPPQTRRFTLTDPDGKVLFDTTAAGGFQEQMIKFPDDGSYDDKLMTLTVSDGPGDFMIHGAITFQYQKLLRPGGAPYRAACQIVLAPDEATAKTVQGGTIYHDGEMFFHPFQVRFYDWLKTLDEKDFVVRNQAGEVVEPTHSGAIYGKGSTRALQYEGLPTKPGFIPLNGQHEPPPFSDKLMHSYSLHPDPGVLNISLRDLYQGFMAITTNDHNAGSRWTNLGYQLGTYAFHFWRPAMRVLQESDAPDEVKAILRDALLVAGDRLSFATGIERVNGNAFSHIPIALKYCSQATQDPMQLQRYKTYFTRFATEAWGVGVGISKSGDLQEHFAHDNHYGSYILANVRAPRADFPNCEFKPLEDHVRELYSYIWCPYGNANPWSSRTHHSLAKEAWSHGTMAWKGDPGPDFVVDVNDGSEWFAARRKNYYIVTYHGRLAPMWLVNGFFGQIGFSGGILCQLSVPGKGLVFHSRLKDSYGKGMDLPNWRNFEIHSIVGTMADGRPLVAAVSEHGNAKLTGNTVESSGEVRDRPIHITRRYTFNDNDILVQAQLAGSDFTPLLTLWSGNRAAKLHLLDEAWEMIPYPPGKGNDKPATVTLYDADRKPLADFSQQLVEGVSHVKVDRDGYGAWLHLDQPMAVKKGAQDTIMLRLIDKPTVADNIAVSYHIEPY